MKKIKNINEALEDVKGRQTNAENAKKNAEQTIINAEKEIQETQETKIKLEEAKKKQEEADKAYDDALTAGGYEKKEKKGNGLVKGIVIGAAAVALIVGGCKLVKEVKAGNIKLFNDNKKEQSSTVETTTPTETTENNGISYNYETNEAFNTEPVVEQEPINAESLEQLAVNFTKYLHDKNINVDSKDVLKFAVVVNIDRLKEDCPELVKEIMGTQSKEEFLGDAFKVIGTSMNYNYEIYETEGKTDNFIRFSVVAYDETGKEHLLLIEAYVDKISAAKNNPEEQDKLVAEFIETLYSSTKSLENIEDGIGLASMLAINDMANHVTFVDGVCQISDENRGTLINHTNAELYIPNIYANMEGCLTEESTMYYEETSSVTCAYQPYTRGLRF